jgi:transcriptional regulator with XRE-family HTH domain
MENKKSFGRFLSHQRIKAKLTQQELADKLYISESAISKWERDVARPDIEFVAELAKIFGITTDELITASIDTERAKEKQEAKYFRGIKATYDFILSIGFGVALLACFIVNLAVNRTLSWFFIVLSALLVASSLLIAPQFIKARKLLYVPLLFLASLFLLLGVIAIYVSGDWFFVVVSALMLAYTIIFSPILIAFEKFPKFVKRHNVIISLCVDIIALLLLLTVINIYAGGAAWVIAVGLPIIAFCLIPVFATAVVIRYVRINAFYKTSVIIFIWAVFHNFINPYINLFAEEKGTVGRFWMSNIAVWNTPEAIANNVSLFTNIAAILAVIAFAVCGALKKR